MDDKSMMALADQLSTLRDMKAATQAGLKDIEAQIEEVEAALIEAMTSQECTGFKHDGRTFSLVIKEYPGAVPETKQELYDAMKKHGFEHLFTINTMTLSATVKELKANNEDNLPDWLEGLIQIFEKPSIRVAKTR
jgi:hypothetical protein